MTEEEKKPTMEEAYEHETLRDELLHGLSVRFKAFMQWLTPNPEETPLIAGLRYLYKIPAVIAAVALSPVVLIILLIVFIVTL